MFSREEALAYVASVFKKEFEDDSLVIDFQTSPKNLEKWDSINNLNLISSIEEDLGIEFSVEEIFQINNIADICDCILAIQKRSKL